MSKYIYRKATKKDFDELYSSPEAEKWLIPHYDNRRGAALAEPSVAKTWKVFRYMENYERGNEISDWFVYLDKDGSLLIMQDRWPLENDKHPMYPNREQEFVILFYSKALENDIQQICEQVVDLGRQGGYYLTGDPEPDFWEDPIISYKMAAPNDYGRYY